MPNIHEFGRVQELIYELQIKQVMSSQVATVTPDQNISDLKSILREKRISGAPVVEDGKLVGIISVEDLIRALSKGEMDALIRDRMTTNLITVNEESTLIEAVRKFAQLGVGRLPVVNDRHELVGIVTGGDINRALLEALGLRYEAEEKHHIVKKNLFDEISSDETSIRMKFLISSGDFSRGGKASSRMKRALETIGLAPDVRRRAAIISYEAEMNLIIHTTRGGELSVEISPDRLKICTTDAGPGIPNIDKALQPGWSTAPHWICELGFGAGMGLVNMKRCADEMKLESKPEIGTRLEVVIYPQLHS
jgi:CBS domain-containing protein/anti-sigma regulatory factor (Ser/Thr protein kinase)